MIFFTVVGIALSFRRRREFSQVWWLLVALTAASIFLMLPPSAFLWRHLPELKFLQFPWRWLLPLSLTFAFFAAAVSGRRQWIWWLTLVCAIFATGATIAGDITWDSEDVPALARFSRLCLHDHRSDSEDLGSPLLLPLIGMSLNILLLATVPQASEIIAEACSIACFNASSVCSPSGSSYHMFSWNPLRRR